MNPPAQFDARTCALTDPEPLRQALVVVGSEPDRFLARIEPPQPYIVESTGLFGRTKRDEIAVGAQVVSLQMEDGSGLFEAVILHPEGWPTLVGGVPTPPGARIGQAQAGFFTVEFDDAASPARVAQEVMALLALVFRTDLGTHWTIRVDEI